MQPLSFEQISDELKKQLNDKRKLDAWRQWLAKQIKAADVDYADDYRPASPDAPPADVTPVTPPK